MKTFLVSYDLGIPETHTDYLNLIKYIKSVYPHWARPVKSVWIIKSVKDASQIRDEIKEELDLNDKLVVVELQGNWATYNVSKEVTDWLRNNI